MGLFSRFFGKPAPANEPISQAIAAVPREVRTDTAHLDLLAHFVWEKASALDLDPDWEQLLGEPPRSAIQRMVQAGLLSALSTSARLDRVLNVAELKTHLKAHGLGVSGNKQALIDRLAEHVPALAESLANKVEAFSPTPAGQALIDARAVEVVPLKTQYTLATIVAPIDRAAA